MSSKKPNLTIQIQQPSDEYTSKFQGYVEQYHDYISSQLPPELPTRRIPHPRHEPDIRASQVSQKSNASNVSHSSAILERAEQLLLEERLEKNMKSLSRNKVKNLSMSKYASRKSYKPEIREEEPRFSYKKTQQEEHIVRSIPRSKSTSSISAEQSRAKVLQEIAEKLRRLEKVKHTEKSDLIIQTKSQIHSQANSRVVSEENSQTHSRVQRIKQIKDQMIKQRGGKLEHLLKDIKKSNKQAYKVVYTIKKTNKNGSPFEKSLKMRDKIHEQSRKAVTSTVGTNLFNVQKSDPLKMLVNQLQNVRMQLKQVKNKNDQLLHISQMRSVNTSYVGNLDSASQSSRITRQVQTIEFDEGSIGSQRRPNSPNTSGSNFQPKFTKGQNKNSSLYTVNNSYQQYQIVEHPNVLQPCFACGCTCRSRINLVK